MDIKTFTKTLVTYIASGVLGFISVTLFCQTAHAGVIYPPASLLQPNDIVSSHIRDDTIVGDDIASTTDITVGSITATSTATTSTFAAGITLGSSGITYSDGSVQTTKAGGSLAHVLTAGKYISAGDAVSLWRFASTTGDPSGTRTGTENLDVWGEALQQTITIPDDIRWLDKIEVSIFKNGTPSGNLSWAFYEDADLNGEPDGTALASGALPFSSITDTSAPGTYYTFNIGQTVEPDAGYLWRITGQDGCCGTEIRIDYVSDSSYTGGTAYRSTDGWSNMTDQPYDLLFRLTGAPSQGGHVVPATVSNFGSTERFLGFAAANAATNTSVTVISDGLLDVFTDLYAGFDYIMGSTAGSIQRITGTSTARVGFAISTSTLYVTRGQDL